MTPLLILLTFSLPLLVLPGYVENCFNTPKTALAITVTCLMLAIYGVRLLLGKPVPRPRGEIPVLILVLLGLNVASLFYTANPYYTAHAAILHATALALFYLTSLYMTPRSAVWLLGASSLAGVLVAAEVYLEFVGNFWLFPWLTYGAVTGTIGNSNYLGAYLIFPLMASAGLILLLKGKWWIALAVGFCFVFMALMFCRARGSWIGFAAGFLCFIFLNRKTFPIRKKTVVAFALLVVCAALWFWNLAPARFRDIMRPENVLASDTLYLRGKYSASALHLFLESPVFGNGLWSYRNLVFDAQAEMGADFFKGYPLPKPESAHNEFLEVFNDGGIVAAGVLLVFLVVLFKHGIQAVRQGGETGLIAATCLSAVVGILVNAGFFFPFRINTTLFLTAVFMGVVEATYRWRKE